jgi:hypothetical protein
VAGPPGLEPPLCCLFDLRRSRLASTPGISATKGNAVTVKASAKRAMTIKEYFMIRVAAMWRRNLGGCCLNGGLELGKLRSSKFIHLQKPYSNTGKEVPRYGGLPITD